MAIPRTARQLGIFVVLSALASAFLMLVIPPLTSWHADNCATSNSSACSVAAAVLRYWWVTLVPLLVLLTIAINWVFERQSPVGNRKDVV
jgi:uncharacterized BrkB/YihY/UPF0761 family membrane protein